MVSIHGHSLQFIVVSAEAAYFYLFQFGGALRSYITYFSSFTLLIYGKITANCPVLAEYDDIHLNFQEKRVCSQLVI